MSEVTGSRSAGCFGFMRTGHIQERSFMLLDAVFVTMVKGCTLGVRIATGNGTAPSMLLQQR